MARYSFELCILSAGCDLVKEVSTYRDADAAEKLHLYLDHHNGIIDILAGKAHLIPVIEKAFDEYAIRVKLARTHII